MPDTPGPVIAALAATLLLGLILGMWLGEVMGRRLPRPTRLDLHTIEREQWRGMDATHDTEETNHG